MATTIGKVLLGVGGVAGLLGGAGVYEHYKNKKAASVPRKVVPIINRKSGVTTSGPGGFTSNAPLQSGINSTTFYLVTNTKNPQYAPNVGAAGSTVKLQAPLLGGQITSPILVDGVYIPSAPGVNSVPVVTTRSAGGTIIVDWNSIQGPQTSVINYGIGATGSNDQPVWMGDNQGSSITLTGCGVPGTNISITPPAGAVIQSPYTIDGNSVSFGQLSPDQALVVPTVNWSGFIYVTALLFQPLGSAIPPLQFNTTIYYGA